MRRMLNCSSHIPIVSRLEVINNFGQKMVNSGHTIQEVRRNLISGLKGWRSKLDRCKTTNQPVHMIVRQSADSRNLKKLIGKSTWFKEKKKPDEQEKIEGAGEGRREGEGQPVLLLDRCRPGVCLRLQHWVSPPLLGQSYLPWRKIRTVLRIECSRGERKTMSISL